MDPHEKDPAALPHLAHPKPPGLREFSVRAVACGLVVALVMGASYPYVVLKLGFGPNVSVVAAILGYLALGVFLVPLLRLLGMNPTPYNRWENNIVQTAGTAAAQTAFMCVLLAAFDMLRANPKVHFDIVLTPWKSFAWLSFAGVLGVLLAVPLRRHYIVDEKLPFADGIAAGETVIVCDSQGPAALQAALALLVGVVASAVLMAIREDAGLVPKRWMVPEVTVLGTVVMARMGVGVNWSLLAVGSGMLVGLRINLSMLLGALLSWVIAPYLLYRGGLIADPQSRDLVLRWVMWPATGMMVAGGLTALLLRWRVLVRTFSNLSAGAGADDFPLRWVVVGAFLSGGGLVVVQKVFLGLSVGVTLTAILLSLPLALVGLRVLGETNWGPISALSNMMQGIFALLHPGDVPANMIASGTTGTIAVDSEGIMQDFKAGDMIGSSPHWLTCMQLLATPVGAAAVSWMYPLLRDLYGIGKNGLSSPISVKWAGFAEILSQGIGALPPGALIALVVGSLLGVVLAVLEGTLKNKTLVPSPTGVGIGMLVPAAVIVSMALGGVLGTIWTRLSPRSSAAYLTPLASGLIAGEALVAVVVPLLVVCGAL